MGLAAAVSDAEYESLADQLGETRLELAECQGELQLLQLQLSGLQARAAQPDGASSQQGDQVCGRAIAPIAASQNPPPLVAAAACRLLRKRLARLPGLPHVGLLTDPACRHRPQQDVRGELDRVQEELAAAEERLAAADQQLADDESDEAASERDLRVLASQLSATRLALVGARTALAAHEARLGGSCAPAAEGTSQVRWRGWRLGGRFCCWGLTSLLTPPQ